MSLATELANAKINTSIQVSDGFNLQSETLTLPQPAISILGNGRTVSIIAQAEDTTASLLNIKGGANLRDLDLRALNGGSCVFTDNPLPQCDILMDGVWLHGNQTDSPMLTGKYANLTLNNMIFELGAYGLTLPEMLYLNASNLIFYDVQKNCVTITNGKQINLNNLQIESVSIHRAAQPALLFVDCTCINLSNLHLSRAPGATEHYPAAIRFERCRNVIYDVIVDDFTANPADAIQIVDCTNVVGRQIINGIAVEA